MRLLIEIGVGFAVLFAVSAVGYLLWDNHERKNRLTKRAQQNVARIRKQIEERDAPPASPHPERSCDKTCDISDAAHGYGGIFVKDGDEELLVKWDVVDRFAPRDDLTGEMPVVDSYVPNWAALYGERHHNSEVEAAHHEGGTLVAPPIASNPLPMQRTRVRAEIEAAPAPASSAELVPVTVHEPANWNTSTGLHEMLPELIKRDNQSEAEYDAELLFHKDPLRCWVMPPSDQWADSPLFDELAQEWMGGIGEWRQDRELALSGSASMH